MNEIDTDRRGSTDQPEPSSHDRSSGGVVTWLASCVAREATPTDLVNIRRWGIWMLAWALLSFMDAEWFGGERGTTSAATVVLNVLVLLALAGTVLAYARYIRQTDELNRSIQLRAFGAGFAAGFVAIQVAEGAMNAGLVEGVDHELAALVMLMAWAVASVVVQRRYR